jgi:exopolysaccharide biosynthesis polyprenyl glycosylphosphotransferase
VSNHVIIANDRRGRIVSGLAIWMRVYLRRAVIVDFAVAVASSAMALQIRFGGSVTVRYAALNLMFPLLWVLTLWISGAYDDRYIGIGSDEFRRVLNAGVGLTAGLAIISYAVNTELSRAYLLLTMPSVTVLDLIARYAMRRRLHKQRSLGRCMATVLAVGPEPAVADLVTELRRDTHHGLSVAAACLTGEAHSRTVAGVPVIGGLGDVADAACRCSTDTVAVLSCSEIDGVTLRQLAWALEKTGTDLCVAPALLDVAGPRTTIRPIAGLTLLHVDHPQFSGPRRVLKGTFDCVAAGIALLVLAPLLAALAVAIRLADDGPALFTQIRVGKDGRTFKMYKFRTMVVDAERRLAELRGRNDLDGVLFKMRRDPRVTAVGARLRKWSADELPQLINVFRGEMSLVGPRPPLPDEAARYAEHVRRRLVMKPGLTGLWQVNGRSDLSWEESVRLDLRYVENWSFALDLQILWKTFSVIFRGSGAY